MVFTKNNRILIMAGTIHERIERLVKEFGGGKNTVLADKIGVSEGNIRGYIKGIMPKYDVLEKIVTSLDVNPDWLLTGRGNMEKEPNLQQAGMQVQEKFPLKTDNLVALQRIPLYNLEATAGLVSFVQRCRCDSDQLYIATGSTYMRRSCLRAWGFDVPITKKRRYCPL